MCTPTPSSGRRRCCRWREPAPHTPASATTAYANSNNPPPSLTHLQLSIDLLHRSKVLLLAIEALEVERRRQGPHHWGAGPCKVAVAWVVQAVVDEIADLRRGRGGRGVGAAAGVVAGRGGVGAGGGRLEAGSAGDSLTRLSAGGLAAAAAVGSSLQVRIFAEVSRPARERTVPTLIRTTNLKSLALWLTRPRASIAAEGCDPLVLECGCSSGTRQRYPAGASCSVVLSA